MFTPFEDATAEPAIRGFLHLPASSVAGEPAEASGDGIVLTHGAGANCQSKLLVAVSDALAATGFTVLRFDLPFRLARPYGPPRPGSAERDRQGLRRAALLLRSQLSQNSPKPAAAISQRPHMQNRHVGHPDPAAARVFLGGHSYGGRQASILLAEDPSVADGLFLLSYPLHPPKKPTELRTKHFPQLVKPAFLVHGTRDPFATIAELQSTLALIPARHALLEVDGAAHDLLPPKSASDLPTRVAREFLAFVGTAF